MTSQSEKVVSDADRGDTKQVLPYLGDGLFQGGDRLNKGFPGFGEFRLGQSCAIHFAVRCKGQVLQND